MQLYFELTVLLLAIAGGVTAIAKKLRVAYPIALVIVGTIVGLSPIPSLDELKLFIVEDEIFHFIIITIFLPALLGEATLKLPIKQLLENKKSIISLAIVGTLLSYIIVGLLSMHWLGLSLVVAFTFAALMAATDPVSVLSIFKQMGADNRLSIILEGESIANDGVAVVLFHISSLSLITYVNAGFYGIGQGLLDFVMVSIGGIAIGSLLSYIFSKLTRLFDDYALEVLFSLVLFYSSFLAAEHFHVSGVMSVVAAGLVFGNYGNRCMTPATKLNIKNFWEILALISNSIVFLMVGLEINRMNFEDHWVKIGIAIGIVLLARGISVYASLLFAKEIPGKWKHIINWGGLRGSLSIALALSLPLGFPGREDIVVLAFSVVLFSLLVQGLSIQRIVTWLGAENNRNHVSLYEEYLTLIQRFKAAQRELNLMREQAALSPILFHHMNQEYESSINHVQKKLEKLYSENPQLGIEQQIKAKRRSLYAEHAAVRQLEKNMTIGAEVAENQQKEIIELLVKNEEAQELDYESLKTINLTQKENETKSVWIISDKYVEIGKALLESLGRGVTYLHGEGAYTGDNKKVIFCVINSFEEKKLHAIVEKIDPIAFLAVGNINNVRGGHFDTTEIK